MTYFWKNLECELCKQRLPIDMELNDGKVVSLLDYDLPEYRKNEEPCYFILESISSNTSKVIHIVNMI